MELLELCFDDRFRVFHTNKKSVPVIRIMNLDLLVKACIVLINSIGKKNNTSILFVDEVKNNSMIHNLRVTMKNFHDNDKKFVVCNFREIENNYTHVKVGYLFPIVKILYLLLAHVFIYLSYLFVGWEKANKKSLNILKDVINSYFQSWCNNKNIDVYIMSDHNFYSTIFAVHEFSTSRVIQHGLVMDKTYYYPILANEFLAWGSRSKELLDYDSKVRICGTYKFDDCIIVNHEKSNSILYCVSSLDDNLVERKIKELNLLAKKINSTLKVKCHPGSFFSSDKWKELFSGESIEFYQNEKLGEISFNVAIIENSTILMDLLYLNKKFILYDKIQGYFEIYSNIIPNGDIIERIEYYLNGIEDIDYNIIRDKMIKEELNGGECNIIE